MGALESIICGIIASLIFKWIETTFLKANTNGTNPIKTEYNISTIKKQFYACAPLGVIFLFLYSKVDDIPIISTFIMVSSTFFLVLALFAFMCCVEMVNEITDANTDTNKKDTNDNIH